MLRDDTVMWTMVLRRTERLTSFHSAVLRNTPEHTTACENTCSKCPRWSLDWFEDEISTFPVREAATFANTPASQWCMIWPTDTLSIDQTCRLSSSDQCFTAVPIDDRETIVVTISESERPLCFANAYFFLSLFISFLTQAFLATFERHSHISLSKKRSGN